MNLENAIRGARNPMTAGKSDSFLGYEQGAFDWENDLKWGCGSAAPAVITGNLSVKSLSRWM
jgi:hypothetical protein